MEFNLSLLIVPLGTLLYLWAMSKCIKAQAWKTSLLISLVTCVLIFSGAVQFAPERNMSQIERSWEQGPIGEVPRVNSNRPSFEDRLNQFENQLENQPDD